MHDSGTSIDDFLQAAAARQPVPGGGAVAAVAGALSASMGEMVMAYSISKKTSETDAAVISGFRDIFTRARLLLSALIAEDQTAYLAMRSTRSATDDNLKADYQNCVMASIRVPQSIGVTAVAVLTLAEKVVEKSNPWLLSDLAVCGELAMATVRCAIHNVRVNLPELGSQERADEIKTECDELLSRARDCIQRLMPAIAEAQASS